MRSKKEVHEYIRGRVEIALGHRSWSWLAREIGVPTSTLTDQVRKPRFKLYALLRIAEALRRDLAFFLPPDAPIAPSSTETTLLMERLARFLNQDADIDA